MNKRRTFLGFLTSVAVLPVLPVRAKALRSETLPPVDGRIRVLLHLIPDDAATRRLGRAVAALSGQQDFPAGAFTRLFEDIPPDRPVSVVRLRRHMDRLCRADFEAGRTVSASGWILARSEADAIALATIYRSA